MKGYLTKLGSLRKEGKLKDEIQADTKAEYEKQKKEIRNRLNEQFPNKFVDEEETPESQPKPEKPKPDIDLGVGLSVGLGLRHRLLWFGSSGGLGGCAWLENGNGIC